MNTDFKLRGSLKLLLQHFSLCVLWCCDSLFIISQRQQGSDHLRRVSLTDRWNDWDKSCHSSSEICLTTALNSAHYASSFFLSHVNSTTLYIFNNTYHYCLCVCRTLQWERLCSWWTRQTRIRGWAAACSSPSSLPLHSSPLTGPEESLLWRERWTMRWQPPISSLLMPRLENTHWRALHCGIIESIPKPNKTCLLVSSVTGPG